MEYDREALDELVNSVDLLEYAEQTMDFRKEGADSWKTNCPLHLDKTPSLSIRPSQNYFHCFSCGVSGNIINWMKIFEGLSFRESVEKLQKYSGHELIAMDPGMAASLNYFRRLQRMKDSKDKDTSLRQILPYSVYEQFDNIIPQEWVNEGISPEVMKKYEIRVDSMSNRIVYPVYDNKFRLIGVKGRTRFKNYKELHIQKYMNYYPVITSDYLTGMKWADPYVKESHEIILVEGIKSVMKLDGWGYHNCVSTETSDINNDQVNILLREGVSRVIVAFDKDVTLKKLYKVTEWLKLFTNVYAVYDRRSWLEDKDSPCDRGREVWDTLYKNMMRIK